MFAILDAEALKAKGNGKGHQTRPEACKPKADSASASAFTSPPQSLSAPLSHSLTQSLCLSLLHATREFIHVEMRKFVINALCLMLPRDFSLGHIHEAPQPPLSLSLLHTLAFTLSPTTSLLLPLCLSLSLLCWATLCSFVFSRIYGFNNITGNPRSVP